MHSTERFTNPDYHDGVQTSLALPPAAKNIFLLLLLKPAAQAHLGKTKLFINCLRSPTKQLQHGKLKNKHREATND